MIDGRVADADFRVASSMRVPSGEPGDGRRLPLRLLVEHLLELSDGDILDAMRHIQGYLDISIQDFRAIYHLAHGHALKRIFRQVSVGSLMRTGAVAGGNQLYFTGTDMTLLIGSFGASAVLVYGAARSPLAQPRNLVGGHVISAFVGVTTWTLFHQYPWLAAALAVATAIAAMHLTRTLHPPGGATALAAVIGSDQIHNLGYLYVPVPATIGPMLLLLAGLLVNNIAPSRRYPEVWL